MHSLYELVVLALQGFEVVVKSNFANDIKGDPGQCACVLLCIIVCVCVRAIVCVLKGVCFCVCMCTCVCICKREKESVYVNMCDCICWDAYFFRCMYYAVPTNAYEFVRWHPHA